MRIGTIGAGEVAQAFAREALAGGHEIVLSSSSGPGALADKVTELGRGASAATVEEAASLDYVLLAVPWKNVEAALRGLPEWKGGVLIDATFLPTLAALAPARSSPVSRPERGSSRRSTPFGWRTSMRGRLRAKASA